MTKPACVYVKMAREHPKKILLHAHFAVGQPPLGLGDRSNNAEESSN